MAEVRWKGMRGEVEKSHSMKERDKTREKERERERGWGRKKNVKERWSKTGGW